MRFLDDMVPPDSGWELFGAKAINNYGQIVGSGEVGFGPHPEKHGYLLTPVPEPSSLVALIAMGVPALLGYAWRRRRRH